MHDFLMHIVNLIESDAPKAVVDFSLRKALDLLFLRFEARKTAAEATGDQHRVELEIERLRETIGAMAGDLAKMRGQVDWGVVEAEASEPGFEEFVDEAFAASAASRMTSKRMTLGRLIARRLTVESDTPEEALLRRALRVVRDMTESQLLLLAVMSFVQSFRGVDSGIRFSSRDQAEEWLRMHVAHQLPSLEKATWTYGDLETLDSVGAIRLPPDTGGTIMSHATSLGEWLTRHGVDPMDGVEGEVGTKTSHEIFARRFPIITTLRHLAFGNDSFAGPNRSSPILELTALTPLGGTIGSLVLEQLAGQEGGSEGARP